MSNEINQNRSRGLRLGVASFIMLGLSIGLPAFGTNVHGNLKLAASLISLLLALVLSISGVVADRKAPQSETAIPMLAVFASVVTIIVYVWLLNMASSGWGTMH
jgi:hypothetical protein